ncbi:related to glutamate dehydrogenase [Richelia intracellularis]|nr:related to glutamate dehydrogenase [Richelia intracellularis]
MSPNSQQTQIVEKNIVSTSEINLLSLTKNSSKTTPHQETIFQFADVMGPAKIIHIYDAGTGLRAIVVVDNIACGASIGGVRMAPYVTTEEVFRLARAMTLKNAAADLPEAAGKTAILAGPKMPVAQKEIRPCISAGSIRV